MSEFSSILLYIFIWGMTSVVAFYAEKKERQLALNGSKKKNVYFIFVALIIWFFYAFADISADYDNYIYILQSLTWDNFSQVTSIEPLNKLIFLLIELFVKDADWVMVVIKSLVIFLYMKAIYNVRDKIHIGYAILAFMSLMYLNAFCLIGMHLAVAFCAYSYSLYIKHSRITLATIAYGIAGVMTHYTCLIYLIVLAFMTIIYLRRRLNSTFWIIFSVAASLITYFYFDFFWEILVQYFPTYSKYLMYGEVNSTGTGVMQFIYHVPLIILLIYGIRYCQDKKLGISILFFELMGFVIALLGYRIETISRLSILCALPILLGVTQLLKRNVLRFKNYETRVLVSIFMLGYFGFRFLRDINELVPALGISSYHMIFFE